MRAEAREVAGEIVGLEEIADTAAGLRADRRELLVAHRLGDDEPRAFARASADDHPALVGRQQLVLEHGEAEAVAEPGDRGVVVRRQERDGGEARRQAFPLSAPDL